jgi:phospholipase/lecithinase/hemolysin
MNSSTRQSIIICAVLAALLWPTATQAFTFNGIVVFGTSLSDPGNAFALTGISNTPSNMHVDEFFVPSAPYSTGGHHFSNGATWIEQLARRLDFGESVGAAFADSPTALNYAVGGARAREDGLNLNLPTQVAAFLDDVSFVAPSDALYVIEMGANDVRDALSAQTETHIQLILGEALASIAAQMGTLYGAGARNFLVLNLPDLGALPSIRILDNVFPGAAGFAGMLAMIFNDNLDNVIASVAALPGVKIARLDVYQKVNAMIANPPAFGLTEVTVPCIAPWAPPFTCNKPDGYLFWDGVHPTKAVHRIFANEAAAVLKP